MPDMIDTFGYIAALLTTLSFVPQVIKVWREDNTASISLSMYILFVSGIAIWLIYGVMIASTPIIAANIVTICLSSSILYKKVRHVLMARRLQQAAQKLIL